MNGSGAAPSGEGRNGIGEEGKRGINGIMFCCIVRGTEALIATLLANVRFVRAVASL